jgi:hypothetical protein
MIKNIKEKTGDLKYRLEWTGFQLTQCPVSSGFTVVEFFAVNFICVNIITLLPFFIEMLQYDWL